ncbi:MAG: RNA-binding protein domain [Acidobacteriales bacterium]|nr:RNA-binding protein domain [Terriglobales bacterium]
MTDQAHNDANAAAEVRAEEPTAPKPEAAASTVNARQLVEDVVKFLVEHPEQVSVEEVKESGGIVLNLRVAQKDVGKVIGKQGRTVRSLRTLLDAAASKLNTRCTLEIIEDEDSVNTGAEGAE